MSTHSLPLPPAAREALERGDLLAAVIAVREAGGIDLAEARRMVREHARAAAAHALEARREGGRALQARSRLARDPRRVATVAPGDAPGHLRWLVILVVLSIAAWLALGAELGP